MTEGKGASQPHKNIHVALAAFQAELPVLTKDHTAKVKPKSGAAEFSYGYADLASVIAIVLPKLGQLGISWTATPTLEDGKLVLKYGLYHGESETCIEGIYPLINGTPQEVGSAITYARRYGLLSLTGTFPAGEDDDGAAAAVAGVRSRHQPQQQQPRVDGALVVERHVVETADSIEMLRDIYRKVNSAGQLDRLYDTGEAVRDAITARRLVLEAKVSQPSSPATPPIDTEREKAVAAALDKIGQRQDTLDKSGTPE